METEVQRQVGLARGHPVAQAASSDRKASVPAAVPVFSAVTTHLG